MTFRKTKTDGESQMSEETMNEAMWQLWVVDKTKLVTVYNN